MSFVEQIKELAQRVPSLKGLLETEEATKNALVMPFIKAIGYDVFNPLEVVPEYSADVGVKKGEKVDYAIKFGDDVIMLIEAKKAGETLKIEHSSQLYRYFSVVKARIAVLTNGVVYQFYSDIDEPNVMDSNPFLTIDLSDLRDNLLQQLQRLTKEHFDLENMLSAAIGLKYVSGIRNVLTQQLTEPDEEFVKFFFTRTHPKGRFTAAAKEQFSELVKRALNQFISDQVGNRLRLALEKEDEVSGRNLENDTAQPTDVSPEEASSDIVTTEEEMEGYHIVKAIICSVLPPERITFRDTKSYFGILIDDNNRKPICRLHLNRTTKYLGLLDDDKNETRHVINGTEEIYKFSDKLRAAAEKWA